jgi:hypothetical protein
MAYAHVVPLCRYIENVWEPVVTVEEPPLKTVFEFRFHIW